MNCPRSKTQRTKVWRKLRRGAAAVECAMVMPLLFLIVFGAIDVGQFINVSQIMDAASREGARRASRNTVTNVSEVEAAVQSYLAGAFPGVPASELNAALTVNVRDSSGNSLLDGNLTTIPTGSSLSVEVSFQYNTVRWLNSFAGVDGQSLQTTTVMRRD